MNADQMYSPKMITAANGFIPYCERLVQSVTNDDKPWTPFILVEHLYSKGINRNGTVFIIGCSSILYYALKHCDYAAILFMAENENQKKYAEVLASKNPGKIIVYPFLIKDFLKDKKYMNRLNLKFDVIVGNPPYQNNGGRDTLWRMILECSCSLLASNGQLGFIIPPGWASMRIKENLSFLSDHNIVYSEMNTKWLKDCFPTVGSEFSILVIDNSREYQGCTVKYDDDVYSTSDYRTVGFIPMNYDADVEVLVSMYSALITKYGQQDIQWGCGRGRPQHSKSMISVDFPYEHRHAGEHIKWSQNSSYFNCAPDDKHIFPVYRTQAHAKKGEFSYSDVPWIAHHHKKIMFTDVNNSVAFYDEGNYGVGEHCRAIVESNPARASRIVNFLNSKLIRSLTSLFAASGSWGGIAAIVSVWGIPTLTDECLDELDILISMVR